MDRLLKLEPVLLKPFIQMHKSIISSVKKAKSIYEHESSVVRSLLFAQNVGETDKLRLSHMSRHNSYHHFFNQMSIISQGMQCAKEINPNSWKL